MMTLAELIETYADDLGDNYPAIADRLNAPTQVANPQTEPIQEPVPITLKALLALVPPGEAAKIYGLAGFVTDLKGAIDTGDREYMGYLLSVAVAAGAVSQVTAGTLAQLLTATIAVQPPATIPGPSLASAAGLGVVTAAQCQAVLNGGA